jgi:hypothetical protein
MEDVLISIFMVKKGEQTEKMFVALRKSQVGLLEMVKLEALSNSKEKTIELLNKKLLQESIIKFNNGYIVDIFDNVKYELEHYQIIEVEV